MSQECHEEKIKIDTKVCKVCGKEKPVNEFDSKGKGYFDTKCKVCGWFIRNKKYMIKDKWTLDEYKIIIDNLLNKKLLLNDIALLLNRDLLELCDVISNYLKVNGKTPLRVICNCNNCGKEINVSPSVYLASEMHFCTKKCNDISRKGKNFHKVIGTNNCINCNAEFNIYDNVPDQKFCSYKCKKEYYKQNPKQEEIICSNCGKSYMRRKQSRYNNNYCSLECELEFKHKQNWEFRKCDICGDNFKCLKTSTQRFCSNKCQGKWQSLNLIGGNANGYNHEWSIEDRTIICEWCGKEHQAKPYQIKNGRRFCSDQCRQDWYAKEFAISEENIIKSREQMVKNLTNGLMNKTETSIQVLVNGILDNLNIEYDKEYDCKYVAIDNYLKEYNLMVEVMGQYWHTDPRFYKEINYEMQVHRIKMDKIKHSYIRNIYDIEILYLWEDDINNKPELCVKLIQSYIKNKGILENYHSFNYSIIDSNITLKRTLIIPYMEYEAVDIRNITDISVKEKMSKKQQNKWITFNCEYCGKEKEELICHYNKNKHHYCSRTCSSKAQIKRIKVNCDNCNKEIEVIPDKYITNKRFFCNQKCQHEYQKRIGFKVEDNELLDIQREQRIKELVLKE